MAGKKHAGQKKKKKRTGRRIALIVILVFLLLFLAAGAVGAYLVVSNYNDLPEWSEIEQDGKSYIYDRDGNFLVEIHGTENREIVDYDQFPQYLIDAVVSTEDTRFYDHSGIDFIRIVGAAIADLRSGSASQGGSTITMQLARNAILNTQEKKFDRKIKEALIALQIERKYSKDEIMGFYLNEVFLGQNIYGVEAAAQHYFNKTVSDLTLSECALLVGMLPSPNAYSPTNDMDKAIEVRNKVLDNMLEQDMIDEATAEAAKAEDIVLDVQESQDSIEGFSYFIDYGISEATEILDDLGYAKSKVYTGGFQIYLTQDSTTQNATDETYANSNLFPAGVGEDLLQSAAVFIDPQTGEILAMSGGREYDTRFGLNRATDMLRQPGPIIKPIVAYGPALEEGYSPN